jgi:hypothetical protein
LVDLDAAEAEQSVLATMARAIQPGKTALIAEVTEPTAEVIDTEMERLGGVVLRRPVIEVEADSPLPKKPPGLPRRKRDASLGRSESRAEGEGPGESRPAQGQAWERLRTSHPPNNDVGNRDNG